MKSFFLTLGCDVRSTRSLRYRNRADRYAEMVCAMFIAIALVYFVGITLIAWLDGKFSAQAIQAVTR